MSSGRDNTASISSGPSSSSSIKLTDEQLARIERNRQKALLIQQKRLRNLTTEEVYQLEKYNELNVNKSQDHDGGFFVGDDSNKDGEDTLTKWLNKDRLDSKPREPLPIKQDTKENQCDECEDGFSNSFLLSNFGEMICDDCKDLKNKHQLITRTEAKQEYLLNDVDLDKRDPPLRCILKKNPHEFARGHMRLYLRLQVEERALEVWGSEKRLEEERESREAKREGRKRKRFQKQIKDLRMQARSSLYEKRLQSAGGHEHQFGEERRIDSPDGDSDSEFYQQECQICGLKKVFEKI